MPKISKKNRSLKKKKKTTRKNCIPWISKKNCKKNIKWPPKKKHKDCYDIGCEKEKYLEKLGYKTIDRLSWDIFANRPDLLRGEPYDVADRWMDKSYLDVDPVHYMRKSQCYPPGHNDIYANEGMPLVYIKK